MPHVIERDDDPLLTPPSGMSKGMIERDWIAKPPGFSTHAKRFDIPKIPRIDWPGIIEEKEANQSRMSDARKRNFFPSLNQGNTNYCWANGVVSAMYIDRAKRGLPHIDLSPASVAAPIKNYRNQGGWGDEALEYLVEHGIASQVTWPANAIDRKYDDLSSRAERKNFRISEWYELDYQDFDQLATCLLLNIPVAVGYNWWSHLICVLDLVRLGRDEYGTLILNSWGNSWGDRGEGVLSARKSRPDGAVAPLVTSATE